MSWLDELVVQYRADPALADLFGIILYSDAQAHVKKVLRDEDYWEALNEVSGPHLAVFAVRTKAPKAPGDLGFVVPVWKEPRENLALLEDLQLPSTEKLPVIVWLTHDRGDLLRCVVPLDDRTQEAAYASIKRALTVAGEAMENVAQATSAKTGAKNTGKETGKKTSKKSTGKRGNLRDPLGVFAAISLAVDNERDIKRLKKALKIWEFLKELKP